MSDRRMFTRAYARVPPHTHALVKAKEEEIYTVGNAHSRLFRLYAVNVYGEARSFGSTMFSAAESK